MFFNSTKKDLTAHKGLWYKGSYDVTFINLEKENNMNKIKLAEALLRRKELNGKVSQLSQIKGADLFEMKFNRKKISEDMDDIQAQVPKLTASQVTAEYDFYARQLRLVDAAIQQANWTTEIEVNDTVMGDYTATKAE